MGNDLDEFMQIMQRENAICYFHNLKFDGAFILDWLFRNDYEHSTDRRLYPREFSTLISDMGQFYSITVKWPGGTKTEFRDSAKKLPFTVKTIAEMFNQPEVKGDIDYHEHRPVGHVLTMEERDYLARDVLIVARAIKEELDVGMTKLTVGSDSLEEYKRIIDPKTFLSAFPVLSETMDNEIRLAYRGGFTYADPRFSGRKLGQGRTYDVNSLYPSVMYDRILPYGEPRYCEGLPVVDAEWPLFIVSITFTAKLRKNHIPCIQIKGDPHFKSTEYQTHIKEPVTVSISNIDLELWQDHYDMDIHSYNGAWQFQGVAGMFCNYIDKWMAVKANSTGGMRAIAKLHLNSLYGKFATRTDITGKIPEWDGNVVSLVDGEPETRNPIYTAMGVFITAYARDVTIRAAQANYGAFAYADTDSLHLLADDDPDNLDIHPSRLGAWKREYVFRSAIFLRAKAYMETTDDGEDVIHVAGLPEPIAAQLTYKDFLTGRAISGKLVPKRVPGGIVLVETSYQLKK